MAHNIFESKVALNRQPAWHSLGYVFDHDVDAQGAAETIDVGRQYLMPLYIHGKQAQIEIPDSRAIVSCYKGQLDGATAVVDGLQPASPHSIFTYGIVSKDYELIAHRDAAALWDLATGGAPIETMGLLGKGETLFLTSKLPTFDIASDPVDNYLLLMSPLDGKTALTARTTSVRVVCQNTLNLALGEHTEHVFRAVHHKGVTQKVREWLAEVWAARTGGLAALKEAYDILARFHPHTIEPVVQNVYPFPAQPDDATPDTMNVWLDVCAAQEGHRMNVLQLFHESPTLTQATTDTLWGAYNAVCEYEDYYRPRLGQRSRFDGAGAARKRQAFHACMSLV